MSTPTPVFAAIYTTRENPCTVASVTIEIIECEDDGTTCLTIEEGRLNRDEVLIIALQALVDEVKEMILPTPARIPAL